MISSFMATFFTISFLPNISICNRFKSRTITSYSSSAFFSLKTYIIVFSTSVTGITISIHINIHIV